MYHSVLINQNQSQSPCKSIKIGAWNRNERILWILSKTQCFFCINIHLYGTICCNQYDAGNYDERIL